MFHNFSIKTASLVASLGVVAAFALVSPVKEAGADPKKVECGTLKHIKGFCEEVGGKEASIKRVMKDAEKAYKAAGKGDIKCQSCHEGANGGALNGDAEKLWSAGYGKLVDDAIKAYKAKK
jgi:hypothetical protein